MIPVSKPVLSDIDVSLVTDAVTSGWVSSQGEYVARFEREFADFCGVRHCILTSNGTVALHLALKALNIGRGHEVIVPDLTFVATANAVVHAEATPITADVRYEDWCIDPSSVERLITSQTRAIIPVHLYGHPAAMHGLLAIAQKHDLKIIEDSAESHGAEYYGQKVGGLGDCAAFSFYGNKLITTGEGGAITTNCDEIAERARFLRDHAMSKYKRYWHTEVGYNFRMTNLQAALGVGQLSQIDSFITERDRILDTYRRILSPSGIILNPSLSSIRTVNWITCVLIPGVTRLQRDSLISDLYEAGIDTRPFFYPLSTLPMYESSTGVVSADLSARGINLPTYPGISSSEIEYISNTLLKLI